MKKKFKKFRLFLFLFLMGFLFSCQEDPSFALPITQDHIGIGLLHCSPGSVIRFYENAGAEKPFDSLITERKKTGFTQGQAEFKTRHLDQHLKPYVLSAGDSDREGESHIQTGLIRFAPEITFRVVAQNENAYQVVINEEKRETAYIKLSPKHDYRKTQKNKDDLFFDPNFPDTPDPEWYLFEEWPEILKRAWTVAMPEKTVFYRQPEGKDAITLPATTYGLGIDSLQGDWARFYLKYPEENNQKDRKFWTKWKDHNKMIVDFTLHGGYD